MKRNILYTLTILFTALQTFAQTYTYDNLNRLTNVVYKNGTTIAYTYDVLGNRTMKKVTSTSVADEYTVTVAAVPVQGGTVSGSGTYASGTTIELVASPNEGYEFVEWNDGVTDNPRTVTVTRNVTYTAQFLQAGFTTDWAQKVVLYMRNDRVYEYGVPEVNDISFDDQAMQLTVNKTDSQQDKYSVLLMDSVAFVEEYNEWQELIVNGDFSSGNTGFTSDYVYVSETGGYALQEEGTYAVGTSPKTYHRQFIDHGDHTTGTGNMLIVNGSPDNTQYVWKQNVPVKKGKTYEFSAWLISAVTYDTAKEKVEYSINGESFLGTYDITDDGWSRFFAKYTATVTGEIELKIRTVSEEGLGNDFAIDDISFVVKTSSTDGVSFAPDEGTADFDNEGYEKIIDGITSTKWCFRNSEQGYVIFHASQPINVTGYKITTGNDTSSYPSRNPKSWTLYGSTANGNPGKDDSSWEVIDVVVDDTKLQARNELTYLYTLPSATAKAYRYFKWVITSPNGIVQVSEIRPTYYVGAAGDGGSW